MPVEISMGLKHVHFTHINRPTILKVVAYNILHILWLLHSTCNISVYVTLLSSSPPALYVRI